MYILDKEGIEELQDAIKEAQQNLETLGNTKGSTAAGQDGWHSEGFKLAAQQERTASKRLGELQEILRNSKVVTPIEQSEKIMFGNGFTLKYRGGKERRFVLGGFRLKSIPNSISTGSPMAKALIGAKVGDIKSILLPHEKIVVRIEKIVSPSLAKEFIFSSE